MSGAALRAEAFAIAEQLAKQALLAAVVDEGQDPLMIRIEHLYTVADVLGGPQVFEVTERIEHHSTAKGLSEDVMALECRAQDAGYLYGLAMGLLLGKGGAR